METLLRGKDRQSSSRRTPESSTIPRHEERRKDTRGDKAFRESPLELCYRLAPAALRGGPGSWAARYLHRKATGSNDLRQETDRRTRGPRILEAIAIRF